ncbi:fimbrial protein [Yersinia kristensenii]|uniref:fimbrial protein n=1 Tax=Yersinia kristensenii TaxID=28152 RepID=UPI0005DAA9C5|nr:fimbrial protein [Yersinia kristensenii]MDA5472681.1 fimbrial protein [Yersinia kristensenii]MDA5478414.1 fimbrial protein [Yersinia kristensenii]MDA5505345.1 fimbrial protein [Yersinia kristensenii]NIK94232.1 type 1 fimbrial protein [Yersinia kristensenii]NIL05856.1 type 1 fimbrial protein [Yersinia kristensenii]
MSLISLCRSADQLGILLIALWLLTPLMVSATELKFAAKIVPGTCTLKLDKSVLPLGEVNKSQLHAGDITAAQNFTLNVAGCTGGKRGSLTPGVNITGAGETQDGKWLFRTDESEATGVGIILHQSGDNKKEVASGDNIALAKPGEIPADQDLSFSAGVSCGACTSVKPGKLTARIIFQFDYR